MLIREKETQRPIIYDVTLHHNLQGMRFSQAKGNAAPRQSANDARFSVWIYLWLAVTSYYRF